MVLSLHPEASTLPSEEKDNEVIACWCPSKVRSCLPVATSQRCTALGFPSGAFRFIALSFPPEASVLPSGEKETGQTICGCSSSWSSLPRPTSQSCTTLSPSTTEASVLLSGEKGREPINFPFPCRTCNGFRLAASHSRMIPLFSPEATVLPSEEMASAKTCRFCLGFSVNSRSLSVLTSHSHIDASAGSRGNSKGKHISVLPSRAKDAGRSQAPRG